MINVIHFWNICGVGANICRYLDRYYPMMFNSIMIDRGYDNLASKYVFENEKTRIWNNKAKIWLIKCFLYSKRFDIIHVHSGIQWLKYYRFINPNKKIIIHLHGTKIRNKWDEWNKDLECADKIIVSTPDLLCESPKNTVYIPNIVDEDLINEIKLFIYRKRENTAFYVDRYALDKAYEYANYYDLKLETFDRDINPMIHKEFLKYLARFEYYIDVKRGEPNYKNETNILTALSMTGLEALALGLKVIRWDGKLIKERDMDYTSKSIIEKIKNIYVGD